MGIKTKYLDSNIYRKAAEIVDPSMLGTRYICRVLETLTSDRFYKRAIEDVYEPCVTYSAYFSVLQDGTQDEECHSSTPLGNLRRKIALDLMAELIETGDINDFI